MQVTRTLFNAAQKATTGLFGLAVHPNPKSHLIKTYRRTLETLTQIPPTAVYRQATEALTQHRLSIIESSDNIKEIENRIGAGIIEEIIWQAEDELKLIAKVKEWKIQVSNVKSNKSILSVLIILSLCSLIYATTEEFIEIPRGVPKSKASLYERKGPNWTCLDGSGFIPYEAINDEYCDCADGSDEPGTSACPNSKFYCKNIGHIPAYISSSRVNDGVCDPECCDGSDEYDGKINCPNKCEEFGAEYRKHLKEMEILRAQGADKKQEYIKYGQKLKIELLNSLDFAIVDLNAAKIKCADREAELKKLEHLEKIKSESSPIPVKEYNERMKKYRVKIKGLKDQINVLQGNVDALSKILQDLKNGHNQNENDITIVKSAITAYDEFLDNNKGLEDFNVQDNEEDEKEDEILMGDHKVPPVHVPEIKKTIVDMVYGFLGLESNESQDRSDESETSRAEKDRKELENKINDLKIKLSKDHGKQDEFAKLDGECFEYDSGEYTYSICMFGAATQKSNKDHSSTHLGNFQKWSGAQSESDPGYYTQQIYANGLRCWNGPERSVKLNLECGIENEIISVVEPEKCEYHLKMKTPAVCPDNPFIDSNKHDEL
ncbi:11027_t:CDS:10 [Diversispora eburnea]|uniref:Glucosidase 2 subunit beta n=2 Tax=Diversisporales TaxID=214509 RepID=A0A9N8V0W2_9GLOM|nr:11027_t:CDS:10 [Diversispora eburnea]